MRLRSLFEAAGTEVAIIFGRFNPPHKGHKAAWELASKSPVWFVGTNESTVGPKDPLPFEVKVEAMKAIWPEVESHIVAETSWLTLASKVYEQYPNATLLCLTDEDWVTKTIVQYNGKEGAHGFYNFKNITQKPTPRLSSATALRDAVTKGDREAFTQAAGVSADTPVAGKPFFDLVAEYLLPYANAPKKVVKKKVAQPVEGKEADYGSDYQDKVKRLGQLAKQGPRKTVWDPVKRVYKTVPVNAPKKDVEENLDRVAKDLVNPSGREAKKYAQFDADRQKRRDRQERDAHAARANRKYSSNRDAANKVKDGVTETIKKIGSQYGLVSKSGKNLGKYPTKAGAEKREKQVNYFKHVDEEAAGVGIITKQNSTVDVNKNTPRKNLKAFKLAK